jgi:hypothetical protein
MDAIHANENHETFLRVLGRANTKDKTKPTTPNTMEHVPWFVRVFIMTVNVRRWLPMMKTRKSSCTVPRNSLPKRARPMRPNSTSPASAMLWTCG